MDFSLYYMKNQGDAPPPHWLMEIGPLIGLCSFLFSADSSSLPDFKVSGAGHLGALAH